MQLLDQKRKLLSENLKEIKEDYVILLDTHMSHIYNAATCLVDHSKDDMLNVQSILVVDGAEGD